MISYSLFMKMMLLLFLVIMLFITGCAVYTPRPTAHKMPIYQSASIERLLKRLSTGSSTVTNIKADFSASITDLKNITTQSCSGILAMAKPDKLRMRGSKAMLPTLFDLLYDGNQLTLFVPRDKTVYRSARNAESIRRGLTGVSFFTDIFFGNEGEQGSLHFLETSTSQYTVYSVVLLKGNPRLLKKVYFERANLFPVRYQYFDGEGTLTCDIRCSDFFVPLAGAEAIPREIALEAPPGENKIVLTLTDVRLNSHLNPELFTFAMPADANVRPLEEYAR